MSTNVQGVGEVRPVPGPELTGAELLRWYWTLEELSALARLLGVPAGGGKAVLTRRLAAALDGHAPPPPAATPRRTGRRLAAPVDGGAVIPRGSGAVRSCGSSSCGRSAPASTSTPS
ncbi:SAP domain-containing protein [Streptomyces lavendulae]|uniref:SAP domain-containing protein n=1 Tax=Streptomyces lavendulae TaxID=1914 RepID=UPI0031E74ECC